MNDSLFAQMGLTRDALKVLQSKLVGYTVLKGDVDYDTARHLSNPVLNHYPMAII